MELTTLLYMILGGVTLFGFLGVLMVIAGRDILFAFARRIFPRSCDVFIINQDRQISRYYRKAVDNVFTIEGKIYITNPNKLGALDDKMLKEVKQNMSLSLNKILKRIEKYEKKLGQIEKNIKALAPIPDNAPQIEQLRSQYAQLENTIELLNSKLKNREQSYYMARRGVYFYIEGDPIPKDFYELFTEMDSITLSNIISRAQTKDQNNLKTIEKELKMIKMLMYGCLIGAVVAGWFAFQNHGQIQQLAQNAGIALTI